MQLLGSACAGGVGRRGGEQFSSQEQLASSSSGGGGGGAGGSNRQESIKAEHRKHMRDSLTHYCLVEEQQVVVRCSWPFVSTAIHFCASAFALIYITCISLDTQIGYPLIMLTISALSWPDHRTCNKYVRPSVIISSAKEMMISPSFMFLILCLVFGVKETSYYFFSFSPF